MNSDKRRVAPDIYDFLLIVGLSLLSYGLGRISIELVLIVSGVILMMVGFFGAHSKARVNERDTDAAI